jgi:hypothetical protein
VSAPFVGPPQLGSGCAYSLDLDSPQCTNTPTIHIAVDSPWGIVGLASCDEHTSIARACSPTAVGEHAYGPRCDAARCWEPADQDGDDR